MFKDKLHQISADLSKYSKKKDGLFEKRISERLDISLKTYQETLNKTAGYLERRDGISVLSKVNRRVDHAKDKTP